MDMSTIILKQKEIGSVQRKVESCMGGITREVADKIMSKIGYRRYVELNPHTDRHECWYGVLDIEKFGVCIMIRLIDAAFKFRYYQNSPSTMSVLQTEWFSPVTNKKHFMKWFNSFVGDAFWFNKRYASHTEDMDERILEDMVTLCDGVLKWFTPEAWNDMSQKEKMAWCEQFGLEHTYVVVE